MIGSLQNWFIPLEANHTRMFAVLFCAALAVQLIVHWRAQAQFFQTQPARLYGPPPRLMGLWQLPTLSYRWFLVSGFGLLIGLLGAITGAATRLFLLLALISSVFYFCQILPLSWIQRKTNLLPLVLLILLAAPASAKPLDSPTPPWPLFLTKLCLAQMYLSAGLQKLRRGGLAWGKGETLQAYLIDHYLWGDTKAAWRLAHCPRVCRVLSIGTLIFELTFWAALLQPGWTMIYAVMGLLFHLGASASMRIHYLKYLAPVYLVFVTDAAFHFLRLWNL